MVQAIRQELTIQDDHVLELHSSMLKIGSHVEVIVLLKDPPPVKNFTSLIGTAKGSFNTPQEADNFIRGERDKWE